MTDHGNYVVQTIWRSDNRILAETWFLTEIEAKDYANKLPGSKAMPDNYRKVRILTLDGEQVSQ